MARPISNPRLLYLKGALFALLAALAGAALVVRGGDWESALLVAVLTWAAARSYYFAFYVVEHYVDGAYRFAGLLDFCAYLWRGAPGGRLPPRGVEPPGS